MERKMRNIHPGETLKMELVHGRKLSINQIADLLNVQMREVSNILDGKANISYPIALNLEKSFGGNADFFMRLQSNFNLQKEVK